MPRFGLSRQMPLLAAVALMALIVFGKVPGDIRFAQVLQNSAHAPAFCILALLFLKLRRDTAPGWPWYLQVLAICVLAGLGIEGIQALLGGDASSEDVLADILGAAVGVAGFASTKAARLRNALRTVCVASALVAVAPLTWCIAAYANRASLFPTLAAFNSPLDLYFFSGQSHALAIRHAALFVPLIPERWPGVRLDEPAPDWTGYRALTVDLANPNAVTLPLTLRVHDRAHNHAMDDRFNQAFEMQPRSRKLLRIPLAAIRDAPRTRRMDMTHIAGIVIFGKPDVAGYALVLNRIALE